MPEIIKDIDNSVDVTISIRLIKINIKINRKKPKQKIGNPKKANMKDMNLFCTSILFRINTIDINNNIPAIIMDDHNGMINIRLKTLLSRIRGTIVVEPQ